MEIKITNIDTLTAEEKKVADKLLKEYLSKIQRLLGTDVTLKIDFKEYDKEGKNKKYSINFQAIFSGDMINSSSWDWDLARAIHKGMTKIENEIEHKYHSSDNTSSASKTRKSVKNND